MKIIISAALKRFKEPSTYAGLSGIMALMGWNMSDAVVGEIAQFLAAGAAVLAVVLKEKGVVD